MRLPETFEEWKYAIEVKGNLALTPELIERRIQILQDVKNKNTKWLIRQYGNDYRCQLIAWFEQARKSVLLLL
jgi:hypothetical protein